MKKIFLIILIVLIPCLSMAFSKDNSSLLETIKGVDSQISITNDNLIPNVDKRRIWKYLKKKQEEEERQNQEDNSSEDENEDENNNNPGLEDNQDTDSEPAE